MVNAVVYHGLSLNTSNLGVNDYLAFAIAGAVEIPAYLFSSVLVEVIGRPRCLCGLLLLSGASLLSSAIFRKSYTVSRFPARRPRDLCIANGSKVLLAGRLRLIVHVATILYDPKALCFLSLPMRLLRFNTVIATLFRIIILKIYNIHFMCDKHRLQQASMCSIYFTLVCKDLKSE